MAGLALKAMQVWHSVITAFGILTSNSSSYGADKIPDKVFEAIPGGYFVEKDEEGKPVKQKSSKQSSRRRSKPQREPSRSPSPREDSGRGSEDDAYYSRKYRNEDRGPLEQDDHGYEERRSTDRDGRPPVQTSYVPAYVPPPVQAYPPPKPYNPADYAPVSAGHRDEYYQGSKPRYDYGQQYAAPAAYGVATAAAIDPYANARPSSVSSSATRYHPAAQPYYDPLITHQPGPVPYTPQPYIPHAAAYATPVFLPENGRGYASDKDRSSSNSGDRPRRKSHKDYDRRRGGSRSRSRSRSGLRKELREHFDTNEKGVGAGAIGAVAGGLLANEVGHGVLSTVLGAVVGGLGANAFEHSRQKRKDSKRRSGKDDEYSDRRRDRRKSYGYDGGYHSE